MRIKKLVTTSSPGHDARRRRDGAAAPRDAAFYAHIRHEARFYGPARRVVAAQELHLLLVGAHGRRDLLAEGGHGSLVSRCAAVQKECCSLPEPSAARRGDGERLGGLQLLCVAMRCVLRALPDSCARRRVFQPWLCASLRLLSGTAARCSSDERTN